MGRLSRFLHLERERPDAPVAAPLSPVSPVNEACPRTERFDGVQTDATTLADSAGTTGHLARFEEVQRSSVLQLDEKRPQDQSFIRCMGCEGDNNRFQTVCAHCTRPLDTTEQRTFNEALWEQRRIQARQAEEDAAAAAAALAANESRDGQARSDGSSTGAPREAWEALARQVKRDTLRRIGEPTFGLPVRWGRGRSLQQWPPLVVAFAVLFLSWFVLGVRSPGRLLLAAVVGGGLSWIARWLRR